MRSWSAHRKPARAHHAPPASRRRAPRVGVLAGVAACVGAVVAVTAFGWLFADLPGADQLVVRSAPDTTKIYARDGRLLFEVLDPRAGRRTRVPLSQLPPHLVDAVLTVEDAGFYRHPGVDVRGIARAAVQWWREGRVVSGGSTITQQLARAVLMEDEERSRRSLLRKAREALLALRLERRYSKDEILERYLGEVYFGHLAYGVEAASRTYFGKSAARLDLAESALLAGLIQSPAAYDPLVDVDAARARQRVVIELMVRRGRIGRQEGDLALAEPLHLAGGDGPWLAPHFVAWVRGRLESAYGAEAVARGGLHVVTSLDPDVQRVAEDAVRRKLADLADVDPGEPDHHAGNAALVAIDVRTGQVLAMVGSADYHDESIDGAVNVALARRQPGSAIKPLTYATAFDVSRWGRRAAAAGPPDGRPALPFTPATVLSDVQTSFVTAEGEAYRPQNYDRRWHGPVTLRRALATSSNTVAVKVLDAVGVGALCDTAAALGIATLSDRERYGLALTLGGGEVRLLELTAAYAGLAAGGRRVVPNPILAVLREPPDASRERPWLRVSSVDAEPALPPEVAFLVTDVLADDDARLPAFGESSALDIGRPAAAKTGTTTDFRDNWTIGYTPQIAAGVWVGNADNRPMAYVTGITGAGPIWHDFMVAAHRSRPVLDFEVPPGVVRRTVCSSGGGLATADCPRASGEWFVAGTEPTWPDESYAALDLDPASGLAWASGCAGAPVRRIYRRLPPDAADWGRSAGIPSPPERDCLGRPVGETRTAARRLVPAGLGSPVGPAPPAGDVAGSAGPSTAGSRSEPRGLVVTRPAARSVFALSADMPADAQRIDVAAYATGPERPARVTLLVDDTPLADLSAPPYRASWTPAPGRHTARAVGVDGDGRPIEGEPVVFDVLAAGESGP